MAVTGNGFPFFPLGVGWTVVGAKMILCGIVSVIVHCLKFSGAYQKER